MKTLLVALVLSCGSVVSMTGTAGAEPAKKPAPSSAATGAIGVDVVNLQPGGSVLVALFDGPKGFPGFKGQVAARRVAVSGSVARVVFDRMPPGRYAIAVVHDANNNGRLDTRLGLLPAEPIGFSNGAKVGRFGPPSFEAAAFDVAARRRDIRIAVE